MNVEPRKDLLPDFLVIGAGKSGTTSLNEYLNQHPNIFMAKKEPNFFAYETINPDHYEDENDRSYYYQSVYQLDDYKALFKNALANQLKGEVSNTYMSDEPAWRSIKKHVPKAKMIAILRHPADRLFSRYSHLVREGYKKPNSFEEFFDRDSYWWKRADLINEGFYYQKLKPYFDNFPRENFRVYLYEDFISKTDEVVKDIFEFLGVDSEVKVGTDVVYNKTGKVKNKAMHKLVGPNSWPIRFVKENFSGLHQWLKNRPGVYGSLMKLRSKNLEKSELPANLRQRVIDEIYRNDIEQLGKLLQRDLSHWLKGN